MLGGEIEFVIDGGAYATLSPTVLSRGTIHAAGPYKWPCLRIRSKALATNTPPSGAFRGFGAPQTQFATEVHMDRIAAELGLDPVRLREINALRPGDTTATGQRLGKDCSALQVLREAVKRTGFRKRRRAIDGINGTSAFSASRLRRVESCMRGSTSGNAPLQLNRIERALLSECMRIRTAVRRRKTRVE